jgi:hypothetical protein
VRHSARLYLSLPWTPASRDDYPFFQVRFAKGDCRACPVRARCTRAATRPRQLSLRPREEHAALQLARERQATDCTMRNCHPAAWTVIELTAILLAALRVV